MQYPLISEYIESIRYAEDNFDKLKNLRPVLDANGNPIMSSGNFAVVFKMIDINTDKLYAVKCFTREQEGRAERYELISEYVKKIDSPYIAPMRYIEDELFVDTMNSSDEEFPVLLMDWVEGKTLSAFLNDIAHEIKDNEIDWNNEMQDVALFELRCLPYNFIRMAFWLLKQTFSHGDIKPDNIIIKEDGTCVLVDYDGMRVPSMQGMNVSSYGTPNFRNPLAKDTLGNCDAYAISTIALSICAFSIEPHLITECNNDYCLITEKGALELHRQRFFINEKLMSNKLFNELLGIYLHTLSQNKLNIAYFEDCLSPYLCPNEFDLHETEMLDFEICHYWEDSYGVRYSLDGRKLLYASRNLDELDYHVREGVLVICNSALQNRKLHSVTLPNSVISIGSIAFANNDNMVQCNIPQSVKFIVWNNPWGGCFCIKRMNNLSPHFVIQNGILYSSDFRIAYGLIYWKQHNISIDHRVEKVASNAFWSDRGKYSSFIKSIDLPNVKEIGFTAFLKCMNCEFNIGRNISTLNNGTFSYCESLQSIFLESIKHIPQKAFEHCQRLKSVIFTNDLETIEDKAFLGCSSLEVISIPKNVAFISDNAFNECCSLKEINVDSENKYFCSKNGILYNKAGTRLIKYPSGRKDRRFIIPYKVTEIGDNSIRDCSAIEEIASKGSIFYFGKAVLSNCKSLYYYNIHLDDKADTSSKARYYFQKSHSIR